MKIRFSVVMLSLLAVSALVALGAADDAPMSSVIKTNDTASDFIESDLARNVTISEGNLSSEISVQGIWRLSLEKMDITMALSQSNDVIFGQAKNDTEYPWNGVASGWLSGNQSSISLSAKVGDILVSTLLEGKVDGEIIKGSYIQSDGSTKYSTGEFTAIMISPDISDYKPAALEMPIKKAQSEEATEDTADKDVEPARENAKNRFKSVTDLAKGINPNIMPNMAPI